MARTALSSRSPIPRRRLRGVRLALLALRLAAGLALTPRAQAATVDVTVAITSVRNVSAGDAFWGAPDFFAKYLVDGTWFQTPIVMDSQGFVNAPGWTFTKTVSRTASGSTIRVRLELWDFDAPLSPAGVDIDPSSCSGSFPYGCANLSVGPYPVDTYGIDVVVNLDDGSWTPVVAGGDSTGAGMDCTSGTESSAANVCFSVTVSPPRPEELVVSTTKDSNRPACRPGDCSLREAVTLADSGDTIVLPASDVPYDLTVDMSREGQPDPARGSHLAVHQSPLVVHGPTEGGTAVIRQTRGDSRVLDVDPEADLRIDHVTITGGGAGGEISNSTAYPGHLHGGGIHNHGYVDLRHVTITGNRASSSERFGAGGGGGIYNAGSGFANLFSVTIADNVTVPASDGRPQGGGIAGPGTYWLHSTVIGNNAGEGGTSDNCTATNVLDFGGNLQFPKDDCVATAVFRPGGGAFPLRIAMDDPLTALRANFTYLPIPGREAVDGGDAQNCGPTDQEGKKTPLDGDGDGTAICDAGAVELEPGSFGTIAIEPPPGIVYPAPGTTPYPKP